MSALICRFEPFDTWFFREARPLESIGAGEVGSVFPPPVRTLLGAVRTALGDAWHAQHGTRWQQFDALPELHALIGKGDDLGPLRCQGPYLYLEDEKNAQKKQRLFPAPATLMVKEQADRNNIKQKHYFLLSWARSNPVHCDLGKVYLPTFPKSVSGLTDLAGSKPASDCWLTQRGLEAVLAGQAPQADDVVEKKDLFDNERRLGIGRDNATRAVRQGLLYQTSHIRLRERVGVELILNGVPEQAALPAQQVIRLGGEGRQAALSTSREPNPWAKAPKLGKTAAAVLYSLTPTPCAPDLPAGIPAGFQPVKVDGITAWDGELNGVKLRIWAAVCGRILREGGWDMALHQSRPVHSLLPAGSALFVESLDGNPDSLSALHGCTTGDEAAFGRGQWLLGKI